MHLVHSFYFLSQAGAATLFPLAPSSISSTSHSFLSLLPRSEATTTETTAVTTTEARGGAAVEGGQRRRGGGGRPGARRRWREARCAMAAEGGQRLCNGSHHHGSPRRHGGGGRPCTRRWWREARLCDGGHHHGGLRWRGGVSPARDSGGATTSILDVKAQPATEQVLPRRRPPPMATQQRWAWIWAWRRLPSSTAMAMAMAGVSAGPGSRPDGPRSRLSCFIFIFKNPFFVSIGNDRYYKPFIFCIVIISFVVADTKYRFPTDTTNTFYSSVCSMCGGC
jgi:hypothetical protein